MKKLISLLLVLALSATLITSALAAYDFSSVEEYPSLFCVDKNEENGNAFIDYFSLCSVEEFSFATPYESDQYYSYAYNDIIVLDYDKDDAYSVWRFWVEYRGTQALKAQSLDLMFNGHSFTFSGIYDEENMETKDNGDFAETYMVKFGPDAEKFIDAMSDYVGALSDCDNAFENVMTNGQLFMTLHGEASDVTVTLPNSILIDFDLMTSAFFNADGKLSDATNPTPVSGK